MSQGQRGRGGRGGRQGLKKEEGKEERGESMTKSRGVVATMGGVTKGFVYSRRSPRQYMTKARLIIRIKGKQNYFCCFWIESNFSRTKTIFVEYRDKARKRLYETEADVGGVAVVWKPASERESRLKGIRALGIADHTIVQQEKTCGSVTGLNAQTSLNKAVSALALSTWNFSFAREIADQDYKKEISPTLRQYNPTLSPCGEKRLQSFLLANLACLPLSLFRQ